MTRLSSGAKAAAYGSACNIGAFHSFCLRFGSAAIRLSEIIKANNELSPPPETRQRVVRMITELDHAADHVRKRLGLSES